MNTATSARPAAPRARRRLADMPPWLGGTVGLLVTVAVWWALADTVFRTTGVVPTPAAVVRQFISDGAGIYWTNASVTTWSAVQGYLWGNLIAVLLAAAVLLVPRLEEPASQIAVISHCIPMTAIGPIILIISAPGSRLTSIVLAAMAVFFTTVVGCLLGLRSADRTTLDVIRAYGGGRWTQLRKVQAVAALPALIAALKIAAPAAFLGAVLGEYFGGVDSGLGVFITAAQTSVRVPQIWSLAIVCGLIAGLGYGIVSVIGRLVTPWAGGYADGGNEAGI